MAKSFTILTTIVVVLAATSCYGFIVPLNQVKVNDHGSVGYIPRVAVNQRPSVSQGHIIRRRSHGTHLNYERDPEGYENSNARNDEELMTDESRYYDQSNGNPRFESYPPYPSPHRGPHPGAFPPPFAQQHHPFPGYGWGNKIEPGPFHGGRYHYGNGHGYEHKLDKEFECDHPEHGFDNDFGPGSGNGYGFGFGHGFGHGHGHGRGHGFGNHHRPGHGHGRGQHQRPDFESSSEDCNSNTNEGFHSTESYPTTTMVPVSTQPVTQRPTTSTTTAKGSTSDPIYDIDVRLGSV